MAVDLSFWQLVAAIAIGIPASRLVMEIALFVVALGALLRERIAHGR